ncbi:Sugar phosphate isomerase/epimerase [Acidobacteriia bacterium SbA2]|nr:Sugar phosphate isomerase/epimerase [Acidobacteriia bacterium SbA2]
MASLSRREFLKESAATVAVAGFIAVGAREVRANPLGLPIGSQTYPHRQRIKDGDFAGLCKDMAALGVGSLELCSPGYEEFASLADAKQTKKVLDDHGLRCPSSHFTLEELRTKQQEVIAWAKDIGMTQMGTASLDGPVQHGVTTMDAVKKAADEYNKIGETAAAAGIQQFLHDERFEMSKVDGRLTYEVLLELLDPKLVKMQFQMSAMRVVGDPVMYFTKYPRRFISMHLQGVDLKAPAGAGGMRAPGVAVGKDSLNWPKIFAAAKTGGVKNYFLEQSWDLTVQGVAFLKTLNV